MHDNWLIHVNNYLRVTPWNHSKVNLLILDVMSISSVILLVELISRLSGLVISYSFAISLVKFDLLT